MHIRFTTPDSSFDGTLLTHPVATELATLLPLDLTFTDFNDVEKVAPLGRALTLAGVPSADEPSPGEIGYYAPTRSLVLYYGRVGRWPGLVRVGRFDLDLDELRALPDGIRIQVALRDS